MKKSNNIILIYILFILTIFQNCTKKSNISTSLSQNLNTINQISVINLPIKISNKLLENKIDEYIPTIIYKDSILEDDNYTYTIKKASKPEIFAAENGFKVTMKVNLEAKTKVDMAGFGGVYPLHAVLKPTLLFIPKITKDWELDFEIQWLNHEWIEKPFVQLGFLSMDVSGVADQILDGQKDKITGILTDFLKKSIQIKPSIKDFWTKIQTPISLEEENKFYLHLLPDSLNASAFENSQGYLKILLQLKSNPKINDYQQKIRFDKLITNNKTIDSKRTDFKLFVDAEIKHNFFDKYAKNQLQNQTFKISEGKNVTVKEVKFKNFKNKAAISVTLNGDYDGILTIYGVPTFNKSTSEIILENPDFEVATKNKLLKAASWLGKGEILKSMLPFLKISIKGHLDELKSNISQLFNEKYLNNDISMQVKLNECTLDTLINVSDSTYQLKYLLLGEAEAEYQKLDF